MRERLKRLEEEEKRVARTSPAPDVDSLILRIRSHIRNRSSDDAPARP